MYFDIRYKNNIHDLTVAKKKQVPERPLSGQKIRGLHGALDRVDEKAGKVRRVDARCDEIV